MFKNLILSLVYFFLSIIISTIFITFFYYFNIFSMRIITILKMAIPIISIFISSYILGRKSNKLGYLEGIKLGLIVNIFFIIISIITKSFNVRSLIYYLILLLSSILGAMIGINLKTKNNI